MQLEQQFCQNQLGVAVLKFLDQAIDARKIERELGWRPQETFESGIRKTVQWYLDHGDWVAGVQSGSYRDWVAANYGQR